MIHHNIKAFPHRIEKKQSLAVASLGVGKVIDKNREMRLDKVCEWQRVEEECMDEKHENVRPLVFSGPIGEAKQTANALETHINCNCP